MSKKSKEFKACRQAIKAERDRQALYQRAADNSPSDTVRVANQFRADRAKDSADTYERWLEANR